MKKVSGKKYFSVLLAAAITLTSLGTSAGRETASLKAAAANTPKPTTAATQNPVPTYPPYNYTDNLKPSLTHPGNFSLEKTPQFVSFGFDDNQYPGIPGCGDDGGVYWVINTLMNKSNPAGSGNKATFDGEKIKCSFYQVGVYLIDYPQESSTYNKKVLHDAFLKGHDIGNHTYDHNDGSSASSWSSQITRTNSRLTATFNPKEPVDNPSNSNGVGIPASNIVGFRAPYLGYNDSLYTAMKDTKLWYDCSLQEGSGEPKQDGTNYYWPYTLDNGSPADSSIKSHPGVWELPAYLYIVPPDNECTKYGVPSGLRTKYKSYLEDGKITGLDYNLFVDAKMTKNEALAVMKYSFDQRRKGNKSPFHVGSHSDLYDSANPDKVTTSYQERQQSYIDLVDYVLKFADTRIVSGKQEIDWLRNPVPLGDSEPTPTPTTQKPTSTPTKNDTFTLKGSVVPSVSFAAENAPSVLAGFSVKLNETGASAVTDKNGNYELVSNSPDKSEYTMEISRKYYLTNIIKLGSYKPGQVADIESKAMWPGDMNNDGAINMTDIVSEAKQFGYTKETKPDSFDSDMDFNKDGTINMTDIMAVSKNFGKTSSDYVQK